MLSDVVVYSELSGLSDQGGHNFGKGSFNVL